MFRRREKEVAVKQTSVAWRRRCELSHFFIATLVLATAMTWCAGLADVQYTNDSMLAFSDGFPGAPTEWTVSTGGEVTIGNNHVEAGPRLNNQVVAWRKFEIPKNVTIDLVRTHATITVVTPDKPRPANRRASLMLWFANDANDILRYQTVHLAQRHIANVVVDKIVQAPHGTTALSVAFVGKDSAARLRLGDIRVFAVSSNPGYGKIAMGLCVLWLVVTVLAGLWILSVLDARYVFGLVALASIMLLGITMSTEVSETWLRPLFLSSMQLLGQNPDPKAPMVMLYKGGHVALFLIFTLASLFLGKRLGVSRLYVLAVMLLLAVATEGVQLHFYERSSQSLDLLLDCVGIAAALFIHAAGRWLFSINPDSRP